MRGTRDEAGPNNAVVRALVVAVGSVLCLAACAPSPTSGGQGSLRLVEQIQPPGPDALGEQAHEALAVRPAVVEGQERTCRLLVGMRPTENTPAFASAFSRRIRASSLANPSSGQRNPRHVGRSPDASGCVHASRRAAPSRSA